MRPSRSFLPKALVLSALAVALAAGSAFAQFYDPALRALDLDSDVARSPRLLGMGSLSLVIQDRYQHISLWDFARNPVGLSRDDSTSTLDMWPGMGSASGVHDLPGAVRQDDAGRTTDMNVESFYRDGHGNAFGAVGALNSLRHDTPYDQNVESSRSVSVPDVQPVLSGPFPYFGNDKLVYALRLRFGSEHVRNLYREFVHNAAGEFIDLNGTTVNPPDLFTPDEYRVSRSGFGGGFAYPIARDHVLALGGDVVRQRINGTNTGQRNSSSIDESRPVATGQATLVGHFGRSLEYGLDGRTWTSSSQQDWRFSISAGVGAVPLGSRGKFLERKETGTSFNSRARWTAGAFALGGQVWTRQSKVTLDPPANDDLTSFNRFLHAVYYRVGADTLLLPDSVVANREHDHAWGYGAGLSWQLAHGIAGVEYHWTRDAFDQANAGPGPKRIAWDVRGGFEYACNKVVTGRLGAGYRWFDLDDWTRQNEYLGYSGSMGLGLRPAGATWNVDLGYQLEWLHSDFGDPLDHRSSRQQLSSVLHWTF
jgi:hypothetical protein